MTSDVQDIQSLPAGSLAARDAFLDLTPSEAARVWHELPAPSFPSVNGEYDGAFLRTVGEEMQAYLDETYDNDALDGHWLGKCYQPQGPVAGEGYNRWRRADGSVERRMRFGTHLGTSRLDGRPALVMTYSSFNRTPTEANPFPAWQSDLVDELRQLADGVLVGVGTVPLAILMLPGVERVRALNERAGLRIPDEIRLGDRSVAEAGLFVLSGPVAPAVGPDDLVLEDQ